MIPAAQREAGALVILRLTGAGQTGLYPLDDARKMLSRTDENYRDRMVLGKLVAAVPRVEAESASGKPLQTPSFTKVRVI